MELQQITEEIDIDSDAESRSRSKPREEGQGFNGTMLVGGGMLTDHSLPSSRADTPADVSMSDPGEGKSCRLCT